MLFRSHSDCVGYQSPATIRDDFKKSTLRIQNAISSILRESGAIVVTANQLAEMNVSDAIGSHRVAQIKSLSDRTSELFVVTSCQLMNEAQGLASQAAKSLDSLINNVIQSVFYSDAAIEIVEDYLVELADLQERTRV